ncbi:MAG: hypothetical protein MH321_04145 [Leptospiraceae bacterium]|nr:hypothetical protein [Leptospiraceae bacterium]
MNKKSFSELKVTILFLMISLFFSTGCVTSIEKDKKEIFNNEIITVKVIEIERKNAYDYAKRRYTPKNSDEDFYVMELVIKNNRNVPIKYVPALTTAIFPDKSKSNALFSGRCCAFYPYFFTGMWTSIKEAFFRYEPEIEFSIEPGDVELRRFVFTSKRSISPSRLAILGYFEGDKPNAIEFDLKDL